MMLLHFFKKKRNVGLMNNKKFLIISLLLVFLTIGGISATDNLSDVQSVDSHLGVANAGVDNGSNILADTNEDSSKSINVTVNYQYKSDNGNITPSINVSENDNKKVNIISKNYSKNSNSYMVKVNGTEVLKNLNVSVSAPGYISQWKLVTLDEANNLANVVFDLKATKSYQLGRDVTYQADKLLNFKNADKVLAITTASVPKLDGKTSENAIDGILNYAKNYISYGRGNILMLRQTATDPIDFCFVVKKGKTLKAAIFLNGSTKCSYLGTISEYMNRTQWNKLVKTVGGENAFSFASLANGWYDGVTFDVLQEAAFHGHICEGTLGGYTITKALFQYYPPIQETGVGNQSPGDITSYKILGVPGDSANDAVLFFLDATSGKRSYIGFNTTSTGAKSNMIAFIRWNDKTNNGTIVVMEYDSKKNKALFEKETGIKGNGSLEQLKYNTWWINRIYKNPASLVNVLIEKDNLRPEQYYYLIGTADNVTLPNGTVIEACNSHGLDYNYIKGLNLPNATRANNVGTKANLTYSDFKNIGEEAATKAKSIFEKSLNVTIYKDMPNFLVLTSAGYVLLNEQSTEGCWDGLFDVLGSRLSRTTLLPVHKATWTPLWFNFVLKQNDGSLMSLYMRYNPDGSWYIGEYNGGQVNNINMSTLNNSALSAAISKNAYPDGNYFSIQSLTNAWSGEPYFDQVMSFLFHNHACPGVQPGFFITDYIQKNFNKTSTQSYTYIANEQYCKDDSLEYILDVSPGLGNYLVQKLTTDEYKGVDDLDEEGILIIWDSKNNIGQAVSINFKWPTYDLSNYATSEAKRAAQIQAFIDLYKGQENSIVKTNPIVSHSDSRWITQDQYNMLTSGGNGSSLAYLRNLPDLSRNQVLAIANANRNNNSGNMNNNSANANHNSNANSRVNDGSASNGGSSNTGSGVDTSSASSSGDSFSVGLEPVSAASTGSDSNSKASPKAYEINKTGAAISNNDPNYPFYLAVVLVMLLAVFAGVIYSKSRNNNEE